MDESSMFFDYAVAMVVSNLINSTGKDKCFICGSDNWFNHKQDCEAKIIYEQLHKIGNKYFIRDKETRRIVFNNNE